jgi:hypothetical protein
MADSASFGVFDGPEPVERDSESFNVEIEPHHGLNMYVGCLKQHYHYLSKTIARCKSLLARHVLSSNSRYDKTE